MENVDKMYSDALSVSRNNIIQGEKRLYSWLIGQGFNYTFCFQSIFGMLFFLMI